MVNSPLIAACAPIPGTCSDHGSSGLQVEDETGDICTGGSDIYYGESWLTDAWCKSLRVVNRPIQAEPLDAEFPCQSTWRWTDELQFGNHSHDALLNVEECRPSSTFSPKLRTDGRDGTWMSRRMPICARCSGCLKTEAGAASKISCESTATSGGINQCGTAFLQIWSWGSCSIRSSAFRMKTGGRSTCHCTM
ncbi:unnamed protein product [Cladocopium goreaui]|uniref:Uncharacterized protein n=1 Tax=Cladocopium goreaui TaxID=2562237 RepID=A0A9P1CW76_9DINO|nr:unnamed protein product [Cladocopium goreaui]